MFWTGKKRFFSFFILIVLPGIGVVVGGLLRLPFFAERQQSFLLVWALAIFWLLIGTMLASQFLFPVQTLRARLYAWGCLLAWYMGRHRPGYVVQNGKVEERLKGNRFGGLVGVVLVDSSSAAVMDDGLQYTRTLGPHAVQPRWLARWFPPARSSTFFLKKYEQVCGVVDLRRHRAMRRVKTITRDGIEVECDLYIDFQIQRAGYTPELGVPYTYDERAVFQAVYTEAVRKEQGPSATIEQQSSSKESYTKCEYRWTDAVINEGAEELRNLVAQYNLDQLYGIDDIDREPRTEIEEQLLTLLQRRMRDRGVDVINVMLGVWVAPSAVVEQRLENWKIEWERRQKIIIAQGESESQRREEIARALAQLEMIENIMKGLPLHEEALSKDIVTLRLIQSLEAMARASAERAGTTIHAHTVEVLRRVLADIEGSVPKS